MTTVLQGWQTVAPRRPVPAPGINGGHPALELKAKKPDLRAPLTSVYTQDVLVEQVGPAEGLNFISKPYTLKALSAKLREILDS